MLLLHTALMPEARPLINQFKLKTEPDESGLHLFVKDEVALVVTGFGRVRAAVGVAFVLGELYRRIGRYPALLNIGVCGTANMDRLPGETLLVRRCQAAPSGRAFYPDILFSHGLEEADLHTFDEVVDNGRVARERFPRIDLVDMEAAGVFEAAALFLPPSRALSIKVVVDFLDDARSMSAVGIAARMEATLPEIAGFMEDFCGFVESANTGGVLADDDLRILEELTLNLRLTETQRHQLRDAARFFRTSRKDEIGKTVEPYLDRPSGHKRERSETFRELLNVFHGK